MPHYCGLVFCQLSLQLANWLSVQWMGELFAWLDGSCYIHLFSPKKPFTSIVSRAVNRPSFAVFARWLISLTRSPIKPTYRVSHIETCFMNWLWKIDIYQLYIIWRWSWNPEVRIFEFQQPVFKKGPFKNYVDKILTIFDYIPTSTWTFFTLYVDKTIILWPFTHLILST